MSISKTIVPNATLATAFQTIANHLGPDNRALAQLTNLSSLVLSETSRAVRAAVSVTVSGSSLTALLADDGAVGVALGRAAAAGDLFTSATTADVTGATLATAKGSALAAGDVWKVTSSTAVVYIGNAVSALDAALLPYTYRGYNVNAD